MYITMDINHSQCTKRDSDTTIQFSSDKGHDGLNLGIRLFQIALKNNDFQKGSIIYNNGNKDVSLLVFIQNYFTFKPSFSRIACDTSAVQNIPLQAKII